MARETLAYLMLIMLGPVLLGWWAFRIYHGRERSYLRRTARERLDHARRMAAKADEAAPH